MSEPLDAVTLYSFAGRPFLVDAEDALAVEHYSWSDNKHGYARTMIGKGKTKRAIHLHVFLLGRLPKGLEWDHINRDPRDNRRSNLRPVTDVENGRNRGINRNNRSGIRGVDLHDGRWRAQISMPGGKR